MIMKRFIMTDIEKKTQANMKSAPKIESNCITSWKVLEISSPNIMQKRLKKAMLGSLKRKVGQNTANPSIPKPIKNGSILVACLIMFGPEC